MKIRNQKLAVILAVGILGVSVLAGGCSSKKTVSDGDSQQISSQETEEQKMTDQEKNGREVGGQETETQGNDSNNTVGEFETTDINGNAYTEKIFSEHDLTMVNIFTTWCSPCVEELPELEKLYEEVADKGVGVVGVVLDTVDDNGNLDNEIVEKAKILQERAKITYPLLIPDSGNMNGRLSNVQSFPETFFVDKEGNIVGEVYGGSGGLEDWREVVEYELANLKGEK